MVDSGFLVNSVLNMLLVVRLPSLVTESEIRVPSHLCGGDFGCASGVQKGTLLYARPGWGGLTCGHSEGSRERCTASKRQALF